MNNIKLKIISLFSGQLDKELTIHQIKNELKRSYHLIYDNTTELTYLELVKNGELEQPFTQEILNGLKQVMEQD